MITTGTHSLSLQGEYGDLNSFLVDLGGFGDLDFFFFFLYLSLK